MKPFQGTTRYELIHLLGQGGMGVVYQVYDRSRNLQLALKTLPRMDPDAIYLFKQEFRALSNISHPNLVALDELSSDGKTWFFTMEYIDGVDFVEYVRSGGAPGFAATEDELTQTMRGLSTVQHTPAGAGSSSTMSGSRRAASSCDFQLLRGVFRQLAEGLCALHAEGKLHRDIKPSNLMITAEGRCVLLDFGLVFDASSSRTDPQTPRIAGTIAYMSPEQAAGGEIGEASDWYAAGVTLYEAIAGLLPFQGTAKQILARKHDSDPAPPSTHLKDVPEDLDALCQDLLQRDPAKRPTGQEVLQRLSPNAASGAKSRRRITQTSTLFVGRSTELAALRWAVAAVDDRKAMIAHVHGVSGAGKSALVHQFLTEVSRREEVVVLAGRCYEQESMPYKALDNLIDALSRHLRGLGPEELAGFLPDHLAPLLRIFPVLGWLAAHVPSSPREINPDPLELRRRAFRCLREILFLMAAKGRLILYIDDLQWGDRDSVALLSEMLRPPNEPPVVLICVSRSEYAESSACLRELRSTMERYELCHVDIPVAALEPEDALVLARRVLEAQGQPDPGAAEKIVRESGGNAYFLHELLQNAGTGEEPRHGPAAQASLSLDEIIWERIRALPEDARQLLEIVAVSGSPLAKIDAYRAAGLSQEDPSLLSVLRASHFVRSAGPKRLDDVVSFHDRVRETLLQRLPQESLRTHHENLASTFESTGRADAERLATHFDGARNIEKARHYYPLAAEKASASLAFDHAVRLYRRALELVPAEGAADETLQNHFANALANSGRGVEAARIYEQLARVAKPDAILALERKAGYQYCVGGLVEEGREVFADVIRRVGLPKPRGKLHMISSIAFQRTWLLLRGLRFRERPAEQLPTAVLDRLDAALALTAGLALVEVIDAIYFSTHAARLALQAGEPTRLMRALALQASAISASGRLGRLQSARLLDVCRELSDRVDEPEAKATLVMCDGLTAFNLGLWVRARDSLAAAESMLRQECAGVAWELATSRNILLQTLCHIGEYKEVSDRISHLRDEVRERGDLYSTTWFGCHVEPMSVMAADRPDEARQTIDESLAAWKQSGYLQQHYLADVTRANILAYNRKPDEALNHITKAWPRMRRNLMLSHGPSRVYALEVRARSALMAAADRPGRRALLRQAAKDARQMLRGGWWDAGTAWATAVQACVASLRDQPEQALQLGELAAERFLAAGMSIYAQTALRQTGLLLGGQQGQERVREAETKMRRLGVVSPARMGELFMPGFIGPR